MNTVSYVKIASREPSSKPVLMVHSNARQLRYFHRSHRLLSYQIRMNVPLVCTTVTPMLFALILLEPGHVFVTLGTRDQARLALVTLT